MVNENLGTKWDVLEQAHAALRGAVIGAAAGDWARPSPCDKWTVAQVLQHAAGDQLGFAAAITGGPGPSEDPFAPSGILEKDPFAIVDAALQAAAAAWATVDPDAEAVPTPVPPNSMAPWLGAGACALDAAVHAWDIAVATGQPSPLTPQLARDLLETASRIVEPLRPWGAYAPALDTQVTDDEVARLLRFLGRRPDWTA
jgi:uncharacterized protein (TIGR03086 family)